MMKETVEKRQITVEVQCCRVYCDGCGAQHPEQPVRYVVKRGVIEGVVVTGETGYDACRLADGWNHLSVGERLFHLCAPCALRSLKPGGVR